MASEYGWSEQVIWWEIPFERIVLYMQAIARRKRAEAGVEEDSIVEAGAIDLLRLIDNIRKEKRGR